MGADAKERGTPLDCITVGFKDGSLDEIRILTDREHDRIEIVSIANANLGGGILFSGRSADGRTWQFAFTFDDDSDDGDRLVIFASDHEVVADPITALRNRF